MHGYFLLRQSRLLTYALASPGMALSSGLKTETQRGETGFADRIKVHRRIDEQLCGEAQLQAAHHQRSGVGVQIGSDAALGMTVNAMGAALKAIASKATTPS
jgi:hypothetical protein